MAAVFVLVAFGLVILYSLTMNVEKPDYATFWEQVVFACVGLTLLLVVSMIDYRYFRSLGWVLFAIGALSLIAVLLFGVTIHGSRSWFRIGSMTVQPVEFAKLCLIIFFAKYFSEHAADLLHLRHLLVSGAGFGLYIFLVLFQPDLGSGLILLGLFIAMAMLVNVRRSHILLLVTLLLVGMVVSWFFLLQPYQQDRILTLVNPGRDPLGQGYNVKQAVVAIGSGRLFGRGLGLGPQSQLNFLPEQKTDFIFAAIAEELGFVGASLLVVLFGLLFYRLFRIARRCRDNFGVYLIFGVAVALCIQMVMNIGMNLGLMQVAGVPLPFLSAGGSSLITTLIAIGVVQSVARRHQQPLLRSS